MRTPRKQTRKDKIELWNKIDDLIGGNLQLCEIPDSDLPRIAKLLGLSCDDEKSLRFCISQRIDSISRSSYKSLVGYEGYEFEFVRNPRCLFELPAVLDFASMV